MQRAKSGNINALRRYLSPDGKLTCAAAFRVAEELGVSPEMVGRAADEAGIRLSRCQLGLFGYGPKARGEHKIVTAMENVPPALAQAIREKLDEGKLPCAAAWEIASSMQIAKMEVSAAAEALGIKIVRCQLGAF